MSAWVLVSGLFAALLVFFLGLLREAWRNNREKLGVLRLLLAEIEHNAEVSRTLGETTTDLLSSPDLSRSLKTETWRDVRTQAAALLPKSMRDALNDYYSPLQTLRTLLHFENRKNDRANRIARKGFKEKFPEKEGALTRNPYDEYWRRTRKAQGEAQDRIKEYLELSWWRRWFDFLFSPTGRQKAGGGTQKQTQRNA